ncbi:hypothetical protein BDR06DRAFT_1014971 [Suillus hirtellus]|nr:hypothetical protein BDR06DRAFT_1014971 [Suillus hirtellus]
MSQMQGGSQPSAPSESHESVQKIAALEEKLQVLEAGRRVKQREINYFISQGRAIRRIVTLFDSIKDLISKNNRRYDIAEDGEVTIDQDRLHTGYITLTNILPWFQSKCSDMEYKEYMQMLKKLRQGANSACGDDTSKLKSLVPDWVNCEFKPNPPVDHEDKYSHGFVNDVCSKLLCPTELDWNNPAIRAGIRDRADGCIITKMSWPTFLYEKYTANQDNLEEGLFKSTLLIQAFKSIFTSPSSTKEIDGEGDGANIIENNRRAKREFSGKKVKAHVAQIIKMHKVSPRSIAYVVCQVFRTSRHAELSDAAKSGMSVNALARQRAQEDDALFDSD